MGTSKNIQSIARAIEILRYISDASKPVSLTNISRDLGLRISTAHGILATLKNFNFISQNPEDDKYFLGFAMLEMGQKVLDSMDIRIIAAPYLQQLTDCYGDTTHLAVRVRTECVYIDKVEGNRAVRISSQIGGRRPVYCTAIGKSLVAYLPEEDLENLLAQVKFKPLTPTTITSLEELRAHLKDVKNKGYSLDLEEAEIGLSCVAAPIRNHLNETIAAISIAMPTNRFEEHGIPALSQKIMDTAVQISRQLGCPL